MEPKRKIEILLLTCLVIGENGFVKIDNLNLDKNKHLRRYGN